MSRWISYPFDILLHGKWKRQMRYGGFSRGEATAKAVDRLQHSFGRQVKAIRCPGCKTILWERTLVGPFKVCTCRGLEP